MFFSFSFLVFKCFIWKINVQATLSCPNLNCCTMEIRFNYFILKVSRFLKHLWKNFVTKIYFLMVQTKVLFGSEVDETSNLLRNNSFIVNLNIVELLNCWVLPLCSLFHSFIKNSTKKCYSKLQYKNIR